MHASVILYEAIEYFFDDEKLEFSIVLFAIALERLIKQHLLKPMKFSYWTKTTALNIWQDSAAFNQN